MPDEGKSNPNPPANNEGGAENKNQQPNQDAKGSGKETDTKVDINKILKENEALRSTQSTLTKKVEEITTENKTFKDSLAKALGITQDGEGEKKPKPEELINNLTQKINDLEARGVKAEAREVKDRLIDSLAEDDGTPIDPAVKDYLRREIEVDKPDEEAIKTKILDKYNSLKSIIGKSAAKSKTVEDRSPAGKSVPVVSVNPTANEVLEKLKKK